MMEAMKDEAVAHVEPVAGYDLKQAIKDTNDTVRKVAELVGEISEAVAVIAVAVNGEGKDGGNA